ncbi:hypothetical protein PoB_007394500 [Plakobranchus ocellatus]|uniref:Uncharacterized protein n=1 Tax=Plakobranchus ocellatus TaxID=259542 RepID=A0AAV4DTG1_9GAST|nr:hypothetical protein PoB_007394500 [Plakobranchus ocellatus]
MTFLTPSSQNLLNNSTCHVAETHSELISDQAQTTAENPTVYLSNTLLEHAHTESNVTQTNLKLTYVVAGIVGDLASLSLGGGGGGEGGSFPRRDDRERKLQWEQGQADYMGVDRFDNIMARLDQKIAVPQPPSNSGAESSRLAEGDAGAGKVSLGEDSSPASGENKASSAVVDMDSGRDAGSPGSEGNGEVKSVAESHSVEQPGPGITSASSSGTTQSANSGEVLVAASLNKQPPAVDPLDVNAKVGASKLQTDLNQPPAVKEKDASSTTPSVEGKISAAETKNQKQMSDIQEGQQAVSTGVKPVGQPTASASKPGAGVGGPPTTAPKPLAPVVIPKKGIEASKLAATHSGEKSADQSPPSSLKPAPKTPPVLAPKPTNANVPSSPTKPATAPKPNFAFASHPSKQAGVAPPAPFTEMTPTPNPTTQAAAGKSEPSPAKPKLKSWAPVAKTGVQPEVQTPVAAAVTKTEAPPILAPKPTTPTKPSSLTQAATKFESPVATTASSPPPPKPATGNSLAMMASKFGGSVIKPGGRGVTSPTSPTAGSAPGVAPKPAVTTAGNKPAVSTAGNKPAVSAAGAKPGGASGGSKVPALSAGSASKPATNREEMLSRFGVRLPPKK